MVFLRGVREIATAAGGEQFGKLAFELADAEVVSHVDERALRRHRIAVEARKDASQALEKLGVEPVARELDRKALRKHQVRELPAFGDGQAVRVRVVTFEVCPRLAQVLERRLDLGPSQQDDRFRCGARATSTPGPRS